MPSTKGKPTDPKLREQIKNEIQAGNPGGWAAWKAAKLAKEYEKRGGGYENAPGSKNEPKKGTPQHKSPGKRQSEEKEAVEEKSPGLHKEASDKENTGSGQAQKNNKVKANTGARVKDEQEAKKKVGRPKKGTEAGTGAGKGKEKVEGTRKSARVAEKRKNDGKQESETKKARK